MFFKSPNLYLNIDDLRNLRTSPDVLSLSIISMTMFSFHFRNQVYSFIDLYYLDLYLLFYYSVLPN